MIVEYSGFGRHDTFAIVTGASQGIGRAIALGLSRAGAHLVVANHPEGREREIKEIEAAMAAPGFYDDRDASKPVIDRHQALMWEVGDLMAQWEGLQEHASAHASDS